MTIEENKEIVRRYQEACNANDLAALDDGEVGVGVLRDINVAGGGEALNKAKFGLFDHFFHHFFG